MHSEYTPPPDHGTEYIYRDDCIIVANKPAGLLSVPGRGADKQDCMVSRIQKEFTDALIVHRLDMATSGLIVLARGKEMHNRISGLFRERRVEKRYIAVVAGQLRVVAGEVALPLGADWQNRPRQKVDFTFGKHATTRYRLLAHDAKTNTSTVELEPVTGRTHQLRVHMAATGHPIMGDVLYGGEVGCSAGRMLLHASALSFKHPFGKEQLSFKCVPPF